MTPGPNNKRRYSNIFNRWNCKVHDIFRFTKKWINYVHSFHLRNELHWYMNMQLVTWSNPIDLVTYLPHVDIPMQLKKCYFFIFILIYYIIDFKLLTFLISNDSRIIEKLRADSTDECLIKKRPHIMIFAEGFHKKVCGFVF